MADRSPLVSLLLVVRNGLPHLRDAVESVRQLSYRNFELVVQDGLSSDGSIEHLRSVDGIPSVSIASEADSGIGQAFNRAIRRARGDIIGSIDADNLLKPNALDVVVARFADHQDAAVVYGACDMIAQDGTFLHSWTPPAFDLLGLMEGAVVPPFGQSFFRRQLCGDDLAFNEQLPTVADFDLWLRLSHLTIVRVFDILGAVRVGDQSSTWNVSNYERMCRYKITALRSFLHGRGGALALERLRERAEAGIHLWALDSMAMIGADQPHANDFFEKSVGADFHSARFRSIVERTRPTVRCSREDLVEVLSSCAREFLANGQPAEAAVYIDVLKRSGCLPETLQVAERSHEGSS